MRDIRKDKNFLYTQSSLGLFMECPYKFKLRYLEGVYWNEDKEVQESFKRGERYHLIAERYFKGINIEEYLEGEDLEFLKDLYNEFPIREKWKYFSEFEIKMRVREIRLLGRYDLITVKTQNKIQIVDFKTNKSALEEEKMKNSLQTRIYLYLLWENYELLQLKIRKLKEISMYYHQVNYPKEKIIINYSEKDHIENSDFLKKIIKSVDTCNFKTPLKIRGFKCEKCFMKEKCKKN